MAVGQDDVFAGIGVDQKDRVELVAFAVRNEVAVLCQARVIEFAGIAARIVADDRCRAAGVQNIVGVKSEQQTVCF